MRTPKNILRHEFIGLRCEIMRSSNKAHTGLKGKIVNETMKTIVIKDKEKKTIPKKDTLFRIQLKAQKVDIDGNYIVARPEDRIKKKFKKW